jgi:outer membrane protein assembly factor BamE (lipoprotein component of BamABCDE complex)
MKKIHVSAILILLVVMSSCAGLIINFKNSQLMSIQKGMTQQEVKTILGKPNYRRFDGAISRVSFQSRAFGDLC